MKKNVAFCFFTIAILSSLFGAHDIIITPSLGYTYTNAFTVKNSITFLQGFDCFKAHNGYVEFAVGLVLDNGFTYIEDVGFAAGPAYIACPTDIKDTDKPMAYPSFFFISRSLIGYTFKPRQNLYINLLTGFGLTSGYPQVIQAGIPVNVSFFYFFTKKSGLNITAVDMLGVGFPYFLTNAFTVKISPVFRL